MNAVAQFLQKLGRCSELYGCTAHYSFPVMRLELNVEIDPYEALSRFTRDCLDEMLNAAINCGELVQAIALSCNGVVYPLFDVGESIAALSLYNRASARLSIPKNKHLIQADYLTVREFLLEKRREGLITILTNYSDITLEVNDLLTPDRGIFQPHQWIGHPGACYWRDSLGDKEKILKALDRDGIAPDCEYRLYRPDGTLCEYQTTYYLVEDYLGQKIRLAVSLPDQWRILAQPQF